MIQFLHYFRIKIHAHPEQLYEQESEGKKIHLNTNVLCLEKLESPTILNGTWSFFLLDKIQGWLKFTGILLKTTGNIQHMEIPYELER